MINKEIIFEGIPGSRVAGRELHVTVGEDNCIKWRVVPIGEQGCSLPFPNSQAADRFARDYARRLGFVKRAEDAKSPGVKSCLPEREIS